MEINTQQRKVHLGFQASAWVNFFIGADFRKRWVDKTSYNYIGIYAKVPFATNGLSSNSNNNSYDSWDWD